MTTGWAGAMRDFYRRLDAELSGLSLLCNGCGVCCHFDQVEHILYASELERRFLSLAGVFPGRPDASDGLLAAGLRCPYQAGGGCQAREGRVLGCRLHFCAWPDADAESEVAERWHGELKRLHDGLGVPWEYRPLLPLETGG